MKHPPGTEEFEECDGWGTVTCHECDGDGYLATPGCQAMWVDMSTEPFAKQRCARSEDAVPLWLVQGVYLCGEHKRQVTWGKSRGLRWTGERLVSP